VSVASKNCVRWGRDGIPKEYMNGSKGKATKKG